MKNIDDRESFNVARRNSALDLGKDDLVFRAATEALFLADKHRYPYLWTFLGVPIIQIPTDIVALQEVIWATKPDVIVETGVARGGSLIFSAAMLSLVGKGKVIGIDIDIRPHNRDTIENHPLATRITLIQGSSIEPAVFREVKKCIPRNATVMVILDSDHSFVHVYEELKLYSRLVTPSQYIVVADTLLGYLDKYQTPTNRSKTWFPGDEPLTAVNKFLDETTDFEVDEEMNGKLIFSASRGGYLRRKKAL